MDLLSLILAFGASVFAGSFATLVGGASMVTIPTLILLGLPPHTAIGTDRLGVSGISLIGWHQFHKKELIAYGIGFAVGIPALLGSFLGANLVLRIDVAILRGVIVAINLLILPIILLSPKRGVERIKREIKRHHYFIGGFMSFMVGIYSGFYGVLSATFLSYVLILRFGQTFLESAATFKIGSFLTTVAAVSVFAFHGAVNYPIAFAVFGGCCIGSYIGVRYSEKLGNIKIKRLYVTLVLIMIIKLLVQP